MNTLEGVALSGNRVERATILGFEGLKSQGVFYGRSKLGVMIRLSGQVAAVQWSNFFPLLSNVTRIDCAVTVRCPDESSNLALAHVSEALEYQRQTAPSFKVVHIDGHKHGSTLLLGSRKSDSYGRIYDKWKESRQECYRHCWRYEVEFKRREAASVAFQLAQAPEDLTIPVSIVGEWMKKRRLAPAFAAAAITRYRLHRETTSLERRLTWLRTQVSPAIMELIELGYQREVEKALFGLKAMQPSRMDDIAREAAGNRLKRRSEIWEQE